MPRSKSDSSPSASTKASKKTFNAYKSLSEAIAEHKARAETKAAKKSASIALTEIGDNDVLFGRGGGTNRHQGNVYFRKLVADAQPEYLLCKKTEKSEIATAIVKAIQSKNGRFLKMQGDLYEEVADNVARLKTSQALREGLATQRTDNDDILEDHEGALDDHEGTLDVDVPMAMVIPVKDEDNELVYEQIKGETETVDV